MIGFHTWILLELIESTQTLALSKFTRINLKHLILPLAILDVAFGNGYQESKYYCFK